MTNQELEEKIKNTFDSIMDKIFKLVNKYGENQILFTYVCVVEVKVLLLLNNTPISVHESDPQKWIELFALVSKCNSAQSPFYPQIRQTPVRLNDALIFLEKTDRLLETEEGLLELMSEWEKAETP